MRFDAEVRLAVSRNLLNICRLGDNEPKGNYFWERPKKYKKYFL